jgi:prephenate dehydrogenase
VRWQKVTLAGVGLLGGSLGMALKARGFASNVTGYVRRAESIDECRNARAVDDATLDLASAVRDADLIVLCTPISRMRPLAKAMLPHLRRGAIITDVGSVKGKLVQDLEQIFASAKAFFVGSHPMAGSEKTGVASGRPDLFEDAVCVITPTPRSQKQAVNKVARLWKSVGGKVIKLDPESHDRSVSRSSHLPHLVAATLANLVLDPKAPKAQAILCANGFRDTTRIASGSPEMWRDIALGNQRHIRQALTSFIQDLERLNRAIGKADAKYIESFLLSAQTRRAKWRAYGAPDSTE